MAVWAPRLVSRVLRLVSAQVPRSVRGLPQVPTPVQVAPRARVPPAVRLLVVAPPAFRRPPFAHNDPIRVRSRDSRPIHVPPHRGRRGPGERFLRSAKRLSCIPSRTPTALRQRATHVPGPSEARRHHWCVYSRDDSATRPGKPPSHSHLTAPRSRARRIRLPVCIRRHRPTPVHPHCNAQTTGYPYGGPGQNTGCTSAGTEGQGRSISCTTSYHGGWRRDPRGPALCRAGSPSRFQHRRPPSASGRHAITAGWRVFPFARCRFRR